LTNIDYFINWQHLTKKFLATRSRGYTDKTHLRGLKTSNCWIYEGRLCLCSVVEASF